jgi:hypothetical protein
MAMAVHRYNTTHIAQWRKSRAMLKPLVAAIRQVLRPLVAIGHTNAGFFMFFSLSTCKKRLQVNAKAPVFNKGMTYQSDGKDLTKVTKHFVGERGVKLTCYCLNDWFLLCIA